jgi:hypothetical protein
MRGGADYRARTRCATGDWRAAGRFERRGVYLGPLQADEECIRRKELGMDPIEAVGMSQAVTQMNIQMAVAAKVNDMVKLQGDQVLQLLESIAQATEPGKGAQVDTQA